MNKKLLIGSITATLILGGTFAVGASELPIFDLKTNKLVKYEKEYIPEELAKTIALNEVNGTVENVEIEKENGHFYYEVEIDKDNIDYDVFVEAYTGKIAYIRVENDDNIKNTNEVEHDDSHDDGTKEVTSWKINHNHPLLVRPAISKTVQNQQVHDDGTDDRDDDRQEKVKSTLSPVPAASKPVTTKPVQKTQVRDHVRDDVRDDDDDRDDDRDDDDDNDDDDDGDDD